MPITETTFGPKRYLTIKKPIATEAITDKQMYDDAGKKLGAYIKQNELQISGPWSVLYFIWDEINKKADIGIAFPIDGVHNISDPELSIVDIPPSKAAMDTLHGPYEGLGEVHRSLMKYAKEKGYNAINIPVMAVEEYAIDPTREVNPANWVTNIYYLHT